MSSANLTHSGLSKAIEGNFCSNTSNLWESYTDGVLKHFVVKNQTRIVVIVDIQYTVYVLVKTV